MVGLDDKDREMLIRIDERTAGMSEDIADIKKKYVLKTEFQPVRAIVFGGVAFILIAVLGAVIKLSVYT